MSPILAEDNERVPRGELAAGEDLDRRDHRALLGDPRHDGHQLQGTQGINYGVVDLKPCLMIHTTDPSRFTLVNGLNFCYDVNKT